MCPKSLIYNISYEYKRLWVEYQYIYSGKIKKKDNSKFAMTVGLHKPFYEIVIYKTSRKYSFVSYGNVLRIYCSGKGHTSAITVPF